LNLDKNHLSGKRWICDRGFFQLNEPITDDIITMHRGLWERKETSKSIQSSWEARPVSHKRKRRIESHFFLCFLLLIVVRLWEKKWDSQYTSHEIITSVQKASGSRLDANDYIFDSYHFMFKRIDEKWGTTCDRHNLSVGEIRKIIGKTKNEDFLKTLKLDR
jgi:transposase